MIIIQNCKILYTLNETLANIFRNFKVSEENKEMIIYG